jgi:2-amino-4-hydroxy-6-hydroxymethyldihydropteridine diphosphokinase
MSNTTYLLLGGNKGNVHENFRKAVSEIEIRAGKVLAQSSLYKTAAWGLKNQPDFLNQALKIETDLSVQELLTTVLNIEKNLGRIRLEKYGARTIDIDILLFNNAIIDEENLNIPHPLLHERNFALAPLAEIAPGIFHPVFHKTISQLLAESPDRLAVKRLIE